VRRRRSFLRGGKFERSCVVDIVAEILYARVMNGE
jgi:hypothetical protein